MNGAAEFSYYRFTSETLPERDRVAVWREVFGRTVIRIDVEPVGEEPFRSDAHLYALPDVSLGHVSCSGFVGARSRALIDSGSLQIGLLVPLTGPVVAFQGGHETVVKTGEAVVLRNDEPGWVSFPAGRHVNMCLPESILGTAATAAPRVIPAENALLRLLTGYAGMLAAAGNLAVPGQAASMIADHLRALAAAAIGPAQDVEEGRGALRAARLRAVKGDIAKHAGDGGLTIEAVARRQGISPSYVRKLLAEDGTSFSGFVLEQRLLLAGRMLRDARFAHHCISTIAYGAGFGDLSYFNRTFRRRFGATPSEVRAGARAR